MRVGSRLLIGVFLGAAVADMALACTTPVYRVAMYDWSPAPYYFVYFHQGTVAEPDAAIHKRITAAAEDPAGANVVLRPVDVTREEALKELPDEVRQAWEQRDPKGTASIYAIFTPWGRRLHAGAINEADLAKMLDSPARKRLCELLGEGHVTAMLLVPGADSAKNQQAEKVIGEVIAEVDAGKIQAAAATPDAAPAGLAPPAQGESAADNAPKPEKLKASTLTVKRDDPAEAWLVRTLTEIEEDLRDRAAEPMVFLVYGRGRALPPLIGAGITKENLADGVTFLAGACSCTVKEQSPGFDLLTTWDWKSAAEALAAKDPTLTAGMEPYYQELVPRDVPGKPAPVETAEILASAAGTGPSSPPSAHSATEPAGTRPEEPAGGRESGAGAQPNDFPATPAPALPALPAPTVGWYASRQTLSLAIGIGLAAIVVLVAGFAMVRRQ